MGFSSGIRSRISVGHFLAEPAPISVPGFRDIFLENMFWLGYFWFSEMTIGLIKVNTLRLCQLQLPFRWMNATKGPLTASTSTLRRANFKVRGMCFGGGLFKTKVQSINAKSRGGGGVEEFVNGK